MEYIDSIDNDTRLILIKENDIIKAKSVLIYGAEPYILGKLLSVFKNNKNLYGYIIFKQTKNMIISKFISEFKYLNWRSANKDGINKFKSIKV